jgi:hypothetical protein
MAIALIDQLHEVGSTCRELAAWDCCEGGRVDRCEKCFLGGPDRCDGQVIKALVGKILVARHETDQVEQQKNYWKGVADNLASAGMNLDRIKEF